MGKGKQEEPKSLAQVLADPDGWPGAVYFVQGNEGSSIKIGYTNDSTDKNLSRRISQLQTGHPEQLREIHRVDPAYIENEKAFHKILCPWRTRERGEWFESSAVLSVIQTLKYSWSGENYRLPNNPWIDVCESIKNGETESKHKQFFTAIILRQNLALLEGILNAPPLPLLGWLLLQEERDDPVGDLAADAKHDATPFNKIATLGEYSRRLSEHIWSALARSYYECFWDIRALGQPVIQGKPLPWEHRRGSRDTL